MIQPRLNVYGLLANGLNVAGGDVFGEEFKNNERCDKLLAKERKSV